ncbi:MAG: helix-turn-helix domain-containing protein [bacterium]
MASDRLTFEKARTCLKLSASTLYRLCEKRRVPYLKVGGLLRFDRKSLGGWLESQRRDPLKSSKSETTSTKIPASWKMMGGLQ